MYKQYYVDNNIDKLLSSVIEISINNRACTTYMTC